MLVTREIQQLLHRGEEVVWVGRPDGLVWGWRTFALSLLAGMWLAIVLSFLLVRAFTEANGDLGSVVAVIVLAWLIIVAIIALMSRWWYGHLLYVFTTRRAILQRGLIGRDFEIVDFERVTDYGVAVGVFDRLFGRGTGSVRIHTASDGGAWGAYGRRGMARRTLQNVPEAYRVQSQMLELLDAERRPAGSRGRTGRE